MWETRASPKFNAAMLGMLKRQEHAQNINGHGLMTSKSIFSPEESKSKILRGYCGGQLINKLLKSSYLGMWPIQGRKTIRGGPYQVIRVTK